ncbi:MAG: hypothetical protein H0X66_09840 [Verrucomicrobia bacterium]|nr:hypothetical protein [Verrucomicrobiota bacterium]
MVVGCYREDAEGFGLGGYAPDFLYDWWSDRSASGALAPDGNGARFTEKASSDLLAKLRKMQSIQ